MALKYGSSHTDPSYANYRGGGLKPMSSQTDPQAANYQNRLQVLGNVNTGSAPAPGPTGTDAQQRGISEDEWNKHLAGVKEQQGFNTSEGNWYQGSQDEYNAEIENAFNAGMGYWNKAEAGLGENLEIMKGQAQTDYAANVGQLGATKTGAVKGLEKQERAGQTKKEDAMASARRLFSELGMGSRQRFGGATSAGGAASEIQGAELQRQQGQTWRQANEFFQEIESQKGNVESQYQAGMLQLQQAKQQALSSAQLEFNNSITQIAAGRAQTEQDKSQARLTALMDLRNKAFTIQQQNQTFEQQLQAMRTQSILNIDAYKQTSSGAGAQGSGALNTLQGGLNQPTNYSQVGQAGQQSTNPFQGTLQTLTRKKDEESIYGGYSN